MRMPRYDVRNDGAGPYATFYCDQCSREFRSQPNLGGTVAKEVGRAALGGFLRNIPVIGYDIANSVDDPRYSRNMPPQQLDAAWGQVQENFHECPTCRKVVCPSDWDTQGNTCVEDSPRRAQIAQAQAEQAAGMVKGFASAFGLGAAIDSAAAAAQTAQARLARCSQCSTPAAPGTKFCPRCGGAMVQPTLTPCPTCHAPLTPGVAFCTNCGSPVAPAAPAAAAPTTCPKCGAQVAGRFCGACGSKVA